MPFHKKSVLDVDFPNYNFKMSSPDMFTPSEDKIGEQGPVWHGTAIGWKNSLTSHVKPLESSYPRFSGITLSSAETSILIISLYAPTHGQDEEFLECLTYLTDFILLNMSENDSLVIGADTNCSQKSTWRRRNAWNSFCNHFSLLSYSSQEPTFHHHNGTSESCIDTILFSKHLKPRPINQLCTLDFPLNLSSHDVLTTSLPIAFKKNPKSKYDHTYRKFTLERIIWEEEGMDLYQNLASKALTNALKFWDTPECIPLLCTMFSNLLVKSAKLAFTTRKTRVNPKENKSGRIKSLEKSLKKAHRAWKKSGKSRDKNNHAWKKYSSARAELQRMSRYEENMKSTRFNNTLIHANKHDRNRLYAILRSTRNSTPKLSTDILETPVGTFYGNDILEGFAADAEHLGKPSGDNGNFDRVLQLVCP